MTRAASVTGNTTETKVVRYALVGTGTRAKMFINPIVQDYRDDAELVAICDTNPGRLKVWSERIEQDFKYQHVPGYLADDFDKMIAETKPDVVIVTTIDAFHDEYIIRAMELGCDAVTEKPMTINDEKCRNILDAVKRTGRKLRVTFNYRWAPGPSLVRKLLSEGIIGEVLHADMEYMLSTGHGADYFRRWHREKDKSGGLMVHKATHHFDLVNWWIDAVPETVFGFGKLAYYGRGNAEKRGVQVKNEHYTGHDNTGDPFAIELKPDAQGRSVYLGPDQYDGYRPDRNVFGDNITAEDTMSVLVKYRTGVVLNYSLNAYLPREGYYISINGTKGRLEFHEANSSHIIAGKNDKELANAMEWKTTLVIHPMFGQAYKVEVPKAEGGHGGADPLIQQQIFSSNPPEETLGRNAGHGQGAASILIGIAANKSFSSGQSVNISDICPQLGNAKHLSELV